MTINRAPENTKYTVLHRDPAFFAEVRYESGSALIDRLMQLTHLGKMVEPILLQATGKVRTIKEAEFVTKFLSSFLKEMKLLVKGINKELQSLKRPVYLADPVVKRLAEYGVNVPKDTVSSLTDFLNPGKFFK
jgi:hypothetical protein